MPPPPLPPLPPGLYTTSCFLPGIKAFAAAVLGGPQPIEVLGRVSGRSPDEVVDVHPHGFGILSADFKDSVHFRVKMHRCCGMGHDLVNHAVGQSMETGDLPA